VVEVEVEAAEVVGGGSIRGDINLLIIKVE
jgi:hypothetical protein